MRSVEPIATVRKSDAVLGEREVFKNNLRSAFYWQPKPMGFFFAQTFSVEPSLQRGDVVVITDLDLNALPRRIREDDARTVCGVRIYVPHQARRGIVSPVTYVPVPSRRRMEDISQQYGLMQPENLSRPYLYKDSGFRIEEEVRFVVASHPNPTGALGGAILNVAARALISDFEISRELPSEEKQSISLIAQRPLNAGATPVSPDFEPGFSDWITLTPFESFSSEPDLPPGVFPDLDTEESSQR